MSKNVCSWRSTVITSDGLQEAVLISKHQIAMIRRVPKEKLIVIGGEQHKQNGSALYASTPILAWRRDLEH